MKTLFNSSLVAALALVLGGCASSDKRADFYYADSIEALAFPPGIESAQVGDNLPIPKLERRNPILKDGQARVVRAGDTRWLEVDVAQAKVWQQALLFWRDLGMPLSLSEQTTGVMETRWKPHNVFYEDGPVRFRMRIESVSAQQVLVFVAVRSEKPLARDAQADLEAELLIRFLNYLGIDRAAAEAVLDQVRTLAAAAVRVDDDYAAIRMRDQAPAPQLAVALERMGFAIQHVETTAIGGELAANGGAAKAESLRLELKGAGVWQWRDADGGPLSEDHNEALIARLLAQLA